MLNAAIKSLELYGLAIVISMLVAVLIKVLVVLTGRYENRKSTAQETQKPLTAQTETPEATISEEVVAAISAAVAAMTGAHRILHIAQSGRAWSSQGRSAQHSHQPKH